MPKAFPAVMGGPASLHADSAHKKLRDTCNYADLLVGSNLFDQKLSSTHARSFIPLAIYRAAP